MRGRTAKSVVLALSFMQSCAGFVSVRGPCAVRRETSPPQLSAPSRPPRSHLPLFFLKDPSLKYMLPAGACPGRHYYAADESRNVAEHVHWRRA
jgi:hypothetical protein